MGPQKLIIKQMHILHCTHRFHSTVLYKYTEEHFIKACYATKHELQRYQPQ